jgi:hypothetical protein
VKIASLQQLPQRWPLCVMPPENLRSYTAAKEISASALLSLNVYQGYVTQFQLVLLLRCRQDRRPKF